MIYTNATALNLASTLADIADEEVPPTLNVVNTGTGTVTVNSRAEDRASMQQLAGMVFSWPAQDFAWVDGRWVPHEVKAAAIKLPEEPKCECGSGCNTRSGAHSHWCQLWAEE
jgi:hypothetical protein